MNNHSINLNSILSKGDIVKEIKDDMLYFTTTKRLSVRFDKENMSLKSFIYLSDRYKLPLRIDFTIKIDAPGFYLFLGDGRINFGTPYSDNRCIEDIVQPNYKIRQFYNYIPINQFVNISVIYDLKAMQILIDGEERFYSEKEKYMKSKLLKEQNEIGFLIRMSCYKRTSITLKSLDITEYDEAAKLIRLDKKLPEPVTRNASVEQGGKPTLETCMSLLPQDIQNEIIKTDSFLRSLKPMKFKRKLAKQGNKITYLASDHGFSYALYPSNDIMHHSLNWYIITNGKPELWHRKDDKMEETLDKLSQISPELADKMFQNLKECINCCKCAVKTLYQYKGKKKLTCHGTMELKMCVSDFEDVRTFIKVVNDIITESYYKNTNKSRNRRCT